jgi:hypothetical protein
MPEDVDAGNGSRPPRRVDYTEGRQIEYTTHALERMDEREITEDEVWWVLAHHDRDVPGDQRWKRELSANMGRRTITLVVVPLSSTVRVVTVFED